MLISNKLLHYKFEAITIFKGNKFKSEFSTKTIRLDEGKPPRCTLEESLKESTSNSEAYSHLKNILPRDAYLMHDLHGCLHVPMHTLYTCCWVWRLVWTCIAPYQITPFKLTNIANCSTLLSHCYFTHVKYNCI